LEVIGVRPGVMIEKLTGSFFGGPVVIRIGNMRLAIGHGMASKVMVAAEEVVAP
jgi:ferrous iron transport protein A